MKFKIEIDCDNDAFQDGGNGELARILHFLANSIDASLDDFIDLSGRAPLYDINGNTVGQAWVTA